MQDLCGLQGIYDLFNCKTPGMGDKGILNKSKKMIDKVLIIRYYNQADCETEMFQNKK